MPNSTRQPIFVALLAIVLLAGGAAAEAATPPSGTVSEASPLVTWTGNPQPPTASAECGGPSNPACDNFQLNIVAPASGFAVSILVTPTGGDDYDLEIYDPAGNKIGGSGNNPGQVENFSLLNPASGTYTVSVANFAAALPFNAQAELTTQDPPPPPGDPSAGPTFAIYPAPGGIGTNSGEPSVGVNWESGNIMYIAGLETLRVGFDSCVSPATDTWTDVSFTTTAAITLDPILFTDPITGRTFASQLSAKCSSMAFTDDDGDQWTPSQGCGINAGVDHQSVGGGPFAPPLIRDPEGPLYPHAVYYCSQDVAIAQCARSDTGGLTFNEATPIYNITECGGLHGHVKVGDDGTVYVPNKGCNGEQAVAVSEDNGLLGSWEVRRVPATTSGEWDPSVGIAADGTIYLGMTNGGRPMAAVSFDKGLTWSTPYDVGVGAGPTGQDILNTAFPVVVAGDGDRAAFGFLGAELGGDGGGQNVNSGHIWYPFVAFTYDAGLTWTTVNLSPDDPVQRGTICSQGTTCESTRNLLDFNDMSIDAEGRVVFAYADGCIGGCAKQGPNSSSELATIARQKSGKRMFSDFDAETVPAAPATEVTRTDAATAEISWNEPFDGMSEITGYNLYRRADFDSELSLFDSVDADTRSYIDSSLIDGFDYCYQVRAINAFGEGFVCGEVCTGEVIVDPPETPCELPGVTVAEDPLGDTNAVLDPTGDPSLDLERVSMAEPFTTDGSEKLVVTMKVDDMALPHPSANWRTFWTSPDGQQYFVALQSCNAAAGITCSYGTFDGTIFSSQGAPEGCFFDADGSIQVTVDKGLVGIDDGTDVGDALAGVEARTQVVVGAACSGLLGTADSAPGETYQIFGNANCGLAGEPPIARDDSASTVENAGVVIDVLANDTSFNGDLTVVGFSDPAFGEVTDNGNGTLTYQPDAGFSSPPEDSFDYTVRDEAGLSASATVTITVNPACEPTPTGSFSDDFEPEAEDGWLVDTPVNTLGLVSPAWAVVTDSGATSPTHSFFSDASTLDEKDDRLLAPPQNLSSSSELAFWHRFEFEDGYDGGVLEVSTDDGSTWADVVAAGGAFLQGGYGSTIDAGFGSAIAGRAAWSGGSAGDAMSLVRVDLGAFAGFDVKLRWRLVTDPLAPGSVPGAGWWIDDVTFSATLEAGTCNAPVAGPDTASTPADTPVVIDVLANDYDPDGDVLIVDSVTQPANGTATNNGDGTVTYEPAFGFTGSDTFTYRVCDGAGLCDTGTVTVTVTGDGGGGGEACDLCADDKPSELTLTYRGGDCSASDNTQGGKADCEDFAGPPPADAPVFIVASDNKEGDDDSDSDSDRVWFRGSVDPDQAFTLDSASGGKDDFGSKVFVHVYDGEGGTLLQTVEIHTSCSAPLVEGERFGSLESGDGDDAGECPAPEGSSGRVHGSGYLAGLMSGGDDDSDSDSDKINFSFDAKFKKGALKGKLKLKDKVSDIEIDAKEITSLSTGDGTCNGSPTGAGAFEFTATGTFESGGVEVEGATFRVCGEDNGKHGKGKDGQPADRVFVECLSGCSYDTASRTPDDGIDGGNVHLHDPIVVADGGSGGSGGGAGSGGAAAGSSDAGSDSGEPGVLDLALTGPDLGLAGTPVLLTATLDRPLGQEFEGVPVTLHWRTGLGATSVTGSVAAVTDSFGQAFFPAAIELGTLELWVTAGDLDSNRVDVASSN